MAGAEPFPIRELLDRLEEAYGSPPCRQGADPVDELVACILSQHTTDAISFPTFDELKASFPDWNDVVRAGEQRLAEVIRRAGLSNQKAKTIIGCITRIYEATGTYSLEFLASLDSIEARNWLCTLPGVGPKTASIVLCFSFGMPVVPVDTHVHRVALRLGVIPEKTDANRAHDLLLGVVPAELAYRFHMGLIEHGRQTCRARAPRCDECVVRNLCRWHPS